MEHIVQVPTEKLLPNPYQPRKQFKSEDMLSLADSIKENGVLQPLLCRQINNSDYFEVVAGERRLRASILANLQTVPCVIIDCGYEQSAVFSILENIQRSDLDFFEEAQAISQLMNHFGLTQEQIAKKLGKSQSSLSNKIRLLKLPIDVRYFIEKEGLTERHARALLKLETEKQMWTTLKAITEKKLNVEQTEAYIDSLLDTRVKAKHQTNRVFKDVRIFVNTFNKAIQAMKDSGIEALSNKTETDEYIEFMVRIPKDKNVNKIA
ncbi:MAG: ParB/RepB/Spo0J family partition protein [Clostridium sp.]|nr:ParB/RepB/Spo0J family partition protein [Clostridium sp.]